jgi:hypothetical protein
MTPTEAITAIIPTSPLVIHPSTEILDETYVQLRKQLPGVKVLLLIDGIHPEERYLQGKYEEYVENLKEKNWVDVKLLRFLNWEHQSGMLRTAIFSFDLIKTPLVFWSEHDIPLNDEYINWQGIVDTLLDGDIGGIRFELTGDAPKANEVQGRIVRHGVPLILSTQYVNWPQVFRLDYFKEFIDSFGDARTYLEVTERDGLVGKFWEKFKYGIYSPEPEIKRCYHINGRERGGRQQGKPYIEIDGRRRYIYDHPYKPAF